MNTGSKSKLVLIDCDGVLYSPSELDINAFIPAFNETCNDFKCPDIKFNFIEYCAKCKSVKGIYNYINYVANQIGVATDVFITKIVEHIDYSNITPDKDGILEKLKTLQNKYEICICSNNHLMHIDKILKAKFNISANKFPFKIFDMTYAQEKGVFYHKESDVFISKLAKHFNINAKNFIWIDDSLDIIEKIKKSGCKTFQITEQKCLSNILDLL